MTFWGIRVYREVSEKKGKEVTKVTREEKVTRVTREENKTLKHYSSLLVLSSWLFDV